MGRPIVDLSGKRFGSLVVLEFAFLDKYGAHWRCMCDCGKEITQYGFFLRRGDAKSCGCLVRKKLVGMVFGHLLVTNCTGKDKNGHLIWGCVCECGKNVDILGTNLVRGLSQSCGCKKTELIKNTCMEKYGFECSLQNEEIKKKTKKTLIEKYGTIHVSQNDDVQKKRRNTCMEKYGVSHHSKHPEIAKNIARGHLQSYTLYHWKTSEEVVCQASYEKAVVEHLNENEIDFKWQHRVFEIVLHDGKRTTYRPDLYLIGKKSPWIEIKGYFRKDAKEKWDIFHAEIKPNSELWDTAKLKAKGIIK